MYEKSSVINEKLLVNLIFLIKFWLQLNIQNVIFKILSEVAKCVRITFTMVYYFIIVTVFQVKDFVQKLEADP